MIKLVRRLLLAYIDDTATHSPTNGATTVQKVSLAQPGSPMMWRISDRSRDLRFRKRKKAEEASESIDLEPTFESRQFAGDMSSVSTVRKAPLPKMTLSDSVLETVLSEPVPSAQQLHAWKKGAQKVMDVIR
ncbi:hypothetical protein TNCV_170331 [Trichonephila clavipes]|nr:hypothetical protein TNCV_170331 [Trichonephila clavipes]